MAKPFNVIPDLARMRTASGLRHRARLSLRLVLFAGLGALASSPVAGDEATRDAMRTILHNMSALVRLSADRTAFASPENAAMVTDALAEVADQAAMLAEHAGPDDTGGEFLARSLDRYALWARRGYERGDLARARALVQEAPDICVACHTRWPSPTDSRHGASLIASQETPGLPVKERARLLVASRQFDRALALLESLLVSPAATPLDLSAITTYLLVSIRVKEDYARPIRILEQFRDRAVITSELRDTVEKWLDDLRELAASPPESGSLAAAERWIERARNTARYPGEDDALVAWVTASGLLHQKLMHGPMAEPAQIAAVSYLIGLAETKIAGDAWLPQAELYLEKAILADPSAPAASAAFDMLEARVRAAYPGPAGDELPDDVAEHLDRLRALITSSGG